MSASRNLGKMSAQTIQAELPRLIEFLKNFASQPLHNIRFVPSFSILTLLVFHLFIGLFVGSIMGAMQMSYIPFARTLGVSIIASTTMLIVVSGFFYYLFLLFWGRTLHYQKVAGLVSFSSLPFLLFQIGSVYFPPVHVIGLSFSALLMVVGLVDNFKLPKRSVLKTVFILYISYSIFWFIAYATRVPDKYARYPKSIDSIEQTTQK